MDIEINYNIPEKKNTDRIDRSKIAVVYARYSSHSQTEQSIEGQLAAAHAYATTHDYTIVHESLTGQKVDAQTIVSSFRLCFAIRRRNNSVLSLFGR